MEETPIWHSDEVLAWTDHDGPTRSPSAPNRAVWFVLAGLLGAVFTAMIFTDTLCPEHRAWVKGLGTIALLGTGTAVVGLVRGWASAPFLTFLASTVGVAIGVIDASHDPTRGTALAIAFAIASATALFLCLRQVSLRWWERDELAATVAPIDLSSMAPVSAPAAEGSAAQPDAVPAPR